MPVLVVGAGPVGLSTALFLRHAGVPALVVDKRDPTGAPPRAGTSLRTCEIFRSIGLGPAVRRAGWLAAEPMCSIFKDSAFGATRHMTRMPSPYAERVRAMSPVDATLALTQVEVQLVALGELADRVRFGVELTGLTQESDRVRAELRDTATGRRAEVTADYLIGADGARSPVRGLAGIGVPDREVVTWLNTAYFDADLGPVVRDWGTNACFVRNDSVFATLFSKNGRQKWSSHIMDYPGRPERLTELSERSALELLRAAIGDDQVPITLHAVNAWEAATGMAERFRADRVFLVGDAAHTQSSAGGLGMNTGIQDGHNLAWKLAEVLAGRADPALLDTYQDERMAAARVSLALSAGLHRGYRDLSGDPADLYRKIAVDYLHAMIGYGYRSAAVLGEVPEPDVLTDRVRVGYRLPHRWLRPGVSTHDLLDRGWTVLVDGFEDLRPGEAVLVRPDGFVAWRGPGPEAAEQVKRRILRPADHGLSR
ncbi:FAD-dependent monooxygenase [Pseudonocardia eucalypti]|uniref:FAD-dependent monooxygenase n=1 Tax=Pseudonocardia eucalypti TaxID=648755 RepID=A0ABP9PPT0_9PSEU